MPGIRITQKGQGSGNQIRISDLAAAGALAGTELVEIDQAGDSVAATLQDIANLGGGGSSPVSLATVNLSAAQLKALNTTPIPIIAAPGAGKALLPIQGFGELVFNSIAYASSVSPDLFYTDSSGPSVGWFYGGLATAVASSVFFSYNFATTGVKATALLNNQPLVFSDSADWTLGNSPMIFNILYATITL